MLVLTTSQALAQFIFEKAWSIPAGERDYITSTANERGIAINPITGHVLIVSRSTGNQIAILDGDTGAEMGFLDMTDVAGGTFPISALGVADDGVIYAANLVSPSADSRPFKIYRWADESAIPSVAYEGNVSDGMRFGDCLDVRGAGIQTQIAAGSGNAANAVRFAIFTTVDGSSFTPVLFSPATVAAGQMQKGIAFGAGDTVYGKINGTPVRHASFDLATGKSALIGSVDVHVNISPVSFEATHNLMAGVNYSSHELLIYDIEDLSAMTQIASFLFPEPFTANRNGVGAVDFGAGKLAALDTQNGVLVYRVRKSEVPVEPTITLQPVPQSVLTGGRTSFSVGASGTKPLYVQWYLDDIPVPGATNFNLQLTAVPAAAAGNYTAVVTNVVGSTTSVSAALTVIPLVSSEALTKIWSLGPGTRPYLANDNNHRGMTYNPMSQSVLVVSRTLGNTNIYVLDAMTGADKHRLNNLGADGLNLISGGTFALNMIGAADDGAVFAANLTTDGNGFTIYRWENDASNTVPTLAYGPANPGITRCGDTLAVRGAGTDTQILVASRNTNLVAVFTTADGTLFEPTVITTADASAGNFGLGVAFGDGNTFWGKSGNASLRHVQFDLATGIGVTLHNYAATNFPATLGPIGVDVKNDWIAGIAVENPDNLRLYDASDPDQLPILIDQELFDADNDNLNGTGALAVGEGLLFALDSNNGLLAFQSKKPSPSTPPTLSDPKVNGDNFEFIINGQAGATYGIQVSTDFQNWTELPAITVSGPSGKATVSIVGAGTQFYRAVLK